MADIKTRQSNKGTIRTIDRASAMTSHVKDVHARTKEEMLHSRDQGEKQESSQAADQMGRGAERGARVPATYGTDAAKAGYRQVKSSYTEHYEVDGVDQGPEYCIDFYWKLNNGKCIEVRNSKANDAAAPDKQIVVPYATYKMPFDDRGDFPGEYEQEISQDTLLPMRTFWLLSLRTRR